MGKTEKGGLVAQENKGTWMPSTRTSSPREGLSCGRLFNQCSESAPGKEKQVRAEGLERIPAWVETDSFLGRQGHMTTEAHAPRTTQFHGRCTKEKMESLNPRVFKVGGIPRAHLVPPPRCGVQETEALRQE